MSISFKSNHMRAQFNRMPLFLRMIAFDFADLAEEYDKDIVITRVSDPVSGESGVHLDDRAFDVRDEHGGEHTFTEEERLAIVNHLNAKYKRNDRFKTCIHHAFGGGPEHFHVQISRDMNVYKKCPDVTR